MGKEAERRAWTLFKGTLLALVAAGLLTVILLLPAADDDLCITSFGHPTRESEGLQTSSRPSLAPLGQECRFRSADGSVETEFHGPGWWPVVVIPLLCLIATGAVIAAAIAAGRRLPAAERS